MIAQLLETVATGYQGNPWSRRLGKYDRSISRALESVGIGNRILQEVALEALFAAGCTEASWRKKDRNRMNLYGTRMAARTWTGRIEPMRKPMQNPCVSYVQLGVMRLPIGETRAVRVSPIGTCNGNPWGTRAR